MPRVRKPKEPKPPKPKRIPKPKKVPFKLEFLKRVLLRKDNNLVANKKVDFRKEMAILSRLLKKFPVEEFWRVFNIKFQIPSLAWFQTADGMKFLTYEYKLFTFEPAQTKKYEFDRFDEEIPSEKDIPVFNKVEKSDKNNSICQEDNVISGKTLKEKLNLW